MARKKFLLALAIMIGILLLPIIVNASNENVQILKTSETEYIIYLKGHLNEELEFAFSNDINADRTALTYSTSALDSTQEKNNIVYIDQYTTENKYLWVKNTSGDYLLNGVEIDLTDILTESDLTSVQQVTKLIDVDTTETATAEKIEGNTKTVITTGKIVIKEEGNFAYQLVKLPNTADYNNLMDLAERISKFNNNTDFYTKLEIYKQFNNIYAKLLSSLSTTPWTTATNKEILQPEDAVDGEQYLVWIKKDNTSGNDTIDIQFLTSRRIETEQEIQEEVRTKLPVTYDDNTLLYILGGVLVAIVIVALRIKSLKKKVK